MTEDPPVTGEAFHTDTFSNARGWTAIRVTDPRSGTFTERVRSSTLKSAVEAQRECIAELKERLAAGETRTTDQPVTRAEFDALADRVRRLESG